MKISISAEDFKLLKRAAEKKWPEAELEPVRVVLSLARVAAKQIAGQLPAPKTKK